MADELETLEIDALRAELLKVREYYVIQVTQNDRNERRLKRLARRLKRANISLISSERRNRQIERQRELLLMQKNDIKDRKSLRIKPLLKVLKGYRLKRLRDFLGKWYHNVSEILDYEESRESYLKAVRNTVTQSIAKKFGVMFGGVVEESEEEESDENEDEIPNEYEEIYAQVHEDLVEHCAEAHITLVKQCSVRLLAKSLRSLSNISKKIGLEQLKICTIESIIEGRGPVNTYEYQGGNVKTSSNPENNTKSIRVTLGPNLRETVLGRKTTSDRSLVSRFYSKTGENLANKIGSSSLVQSFLTYMKEQKDYVIIEKQLRLKEILKNKYFKITARAWRRISEHGKTKHERNEQVGDEKHDPIVKGTEDRNRRFSQTGTNNPQRRGRSSLNSEQKAAIMQLYKEGEKKPDPAEISVKDIGKYLNSQGFKSGPVKNTKSLAVKLPPRASVQQEPAVKRRFDLQFTGSMSIKGKAKQELFEMDDIDDVGDDRLENRVYSSVVKKEIDAGARSSYVPEASSPQIAISKRPSSLCGSTSSSLESSSIRNSVLTIGGSKPPPPPPGSNGLSSASDNTMPLGSSIPPPPPGLHNQPPPPPSVRIPPPPGSNPPPPPPSSTRIPPPPPGSNITSPPPSSTQPPPPPNTRMPPPPPNSGAPSQTAPPPGSFAQAPPANTAPVVKPPQDMITKKLYWDVIPKYKLKTTLWNLGLNPSTHINFAELTSIFAEKKAEETTQTAKAAVKTQVYVTDMKKANNSGIVLSRFPYRSADIAHILNTMDEKKIKSDDLTKLVKLAPNEEELEKLKGFTGSYSDIMMSEQYLIDCWVKVPMFQIRLECFKFKIDFNSELPDVCDMITTISDALSAVRESLSFKNMIAVILSIGNYLNHGTNKGNAQGFSLNTLSQLDTVKGCDKQKTPLIFFILNTLSDRSQLNFITEFEACIKASRFEITDLDLKVAEFNKGFVLMEKARDQALEIHDIKELKIFCTQVDSFFMNSRDKFEELKQAVVDVKKLFEQTLELYGEDKTTKATEFFKKFSCFAGMCKKAHEEITVKKGKEEMMKIAMAKKLAAQKPEVKKEISAQVRRTIRMSVKSRIQGIGANLNKE